MLRRIEHSVSWLSALLHFYRVMRTIFERLRKPPWTLIYHPHSLSVPSPDPCLSPDLPRLPKIQA